jgi:glutathione S-transferase
MLEYVDIDHARTAPGVRIVVSPLVPSPWSEAAKAVFRIANVPVLAVRKTRDRGADVTAWTGVDNVPAVLHGVEPVRTSWAAIVALAARLGEPNAILPADVAARADVMGALDSIAGEDGLGWNARLAMIDASVTSNGERGFPKGVGEYLAKRYGHAHAAMPAVRTLVAAQLASLGDRLAVQCARGHEYLAGPRVGALDVYAATFLTPLIPITVEACPQLAPPLRAAFGVAAEMFGDLLPNELVAHRALVFERHLELPITL